MEYTIGMKIGLNNEENNNKQKVDIVKLLEKTASVNERQVFLLKMITLLKRINH